MTPAFLNAVIDTLLPAEAPAPGRVALPGGTAAGIERIERERPAEFRALLVALLPDYYESPDVLTALGWRPEPPQPAGHGLDAMDEPTRQALDRVRGRSALWRS
jgi:hypothetical protein